MSEFSKRWLEDRVKALEIGNAELRKQNTILRAENAQAKEAIAVLSAGRPLGDIVGLHTAQNAIAEAERLRTENAELRSELTPYENCQCIGWHKHLHGICISCSKPVLSWQDAYQTAVEDYNLLRADAERYRWLCVHGLTESGLAKLAATNIDPRTPQEVDVAIDEAMRKDEPK